MNADAPRLTVSRVVDAPRALVFRAFADPDCLARRWGPSGSSLPRGEIEVGVRPGGFQRWAEIAAADPDLRVQVHVDLTDVAESRLLEGVMHVSGRLPEGLEPFETLDRTLHHFQAVAADVGP